MNEPDSSPSSEIELARFRDAEGVEYCCAVLDKAGIKYRLSSDVPAFDISAVGTGGVNGSMIVMVAPKLEVRARQALLEDARASIQNGLLEDYPLSKDSSDEELLAMLKEPLEWSAYDIAAAEYLLTQRKTPFEPPTYELTEKEVQAREEKTRTLKSMNRSVISNLVIGVTFAITLYVMSHRHDPTGMAQFRVVRMVAALWVIWLLWGAMSAKDDEDSA